MRARTAEFESTVDWKGSVTREIFHKKVPTICRIFEDWLWH